MPPIMDISAYLNYERQKKAGGTPGLPAPLIEQLGYGVTSAQAGRALEGERSAREGERLQMEKEGVAQQGRGQLIQTGLQAPLTYYSAQKLGIIPENFGGGIKTALSSAYDKATGALTPGGPALTTATAAPEYTGIAAEAGTEYGAAPALTTGTTEGIAGVGLGTYAGAAGAGYIGAKYGPGKPQEVGKIGLFGGGGQKEQKIAGGVIKGAGAGALTGFALSSWSGPGAIIGTIVGGIAGGVSQATVICTELFRQGYITADLLAFEKKYHPRFDFATYWGYRFWADPIVKGMKKSKLFTWMVSLFGIPFIKEIAHRVEPNRKGSLFGSVMIKFGVPFCRWIYLRKIKKYRKLVMWHQDKFTTIHGGD